MTAVVFTVTACGNDPEPDKAANDVVQEAIVNSSKVLADVDTLAFSLELGGESDAAADRKVSLEVDLNGVLDESDKENPKISMEVNFTSKTGKEKVWVNGEMRLFRDGLYLIVNDVKAPEAQLPPALIGQLVDKWWEMPLPPNFEDSFVSKDDSSLTDEEKKAKELFEKTRFFTDAEYDGSKKIDGEKTYKYTVKLDEKAIKEYWEEVVKISGEENNALFGSFNIDELLEKISFDGEIFVSIDTMIMKRLSGTVKNDKPKSSAAAPVDGATPAVNMDEFSFSYTMGDFGVPVNIERPVGAQMFNLPALLGGGI